MKKSESANAKLGELLSEPAGEKIITSEHRIVITHICNDAKATGVPVEKLILSLKNIFDRFPASPEERHSRVELRERLIGVCIEEYYKDGSGPTPG